MAVKFLKEATVGTLYGEGEVAGFDSKVEADLIKRKLAAPIKAKAAAAPRRPRAPRKPRVAKAKAPAATPPSPPAKDD